jgi:hypothetical protein
MASTPNSGRRQLEWNALCILCAQFGAGKGAKLAELDALNEAHFHDAVHRAIFREIALCKQRGFSRDQLRRRLPETMTRLGWPDLDFDVLFDDRAGNSGTDEPAELLRKLLESTRAREHD